MSLRERIERDLAITLEGRWGLPVVLISPDGVEQSTRAGDSTPLKGQILYGLARLNPETGEDVVVDSPVVVLRRSSLSRVPLAGETWIVKIPTTPSMTAPLETFVISPVRPPEGGKSIGFIRLYLQQIEQSL
jgi:hypothetical protein